MLLGLNNVEVVYDRVFMAVTGVSLQVPGQGIVALLGANGAGKSTTLKAVSGLLKPERGLVTKGTLTFDGRDVTGLAPAERVRLGIVHVLEGRRVFPHLTPMENLMAATTMHGDRRAAAHRAEEVMERFPRLRQRARSEAGYLSGGEQQMLAIGRALMTAPRLIMLDEPSLGLAPHLVDEIFDTIAHIAAETGMGVLLVEQNADAALAIAAHGYLIENGRVVMSGPAAELRDNPDIRDFYLGGGGSVDYARVKHYRRRKRWLS
ncbi:ABC transporter ATP-binding protein [Tistrella mobilis]|uniref:ABC transporter related protein n=1 Tax=Tistrella mobilis (strain KA081020-065) TaxID=1110502 RepID=I3TS28_TISMK|nr:ABC transporter ATP-binding protein [Tistrella mobilis]AFK55566.1 ABC transporter related protein [Tistrella mobilis KA081020-065]